MKAYANIKDPCIDSYDIIRAFLNGSFLKENWKLILMSLVLFIIRAIVELEEVLEEVMDEKSAEMLDEILRNELDTGEKDIDTFTML